MKINCIIIEDEIAGQTILSKKINAFFPECCIDAIIESKEDAVEYLKNNTVDLVLLDVHIKGGLGTDVLKSVEVNFETIFITAHKEYAIEAINNGASYYLLKPFIDTEFKKGMTLVLDRIKNMKEVPSTPVSQKNSPKEKENDKVLSDALELRLLNDLEEFEKSTKYTDKQFSLPNLAVVLNTNTRYLSYVLNTHKKQDFNTYINTLRINYFIEKIKNSDEFKNYKFSAVAEECGFSSHSKFSAIFKSVMGITPSEFIENMERE